MTASTPRSPSASRTTGIPPPPLAMTTNPASTRARTAGASRIARGSGDATSRRQPLAPRSSQMLAVLDQEGRLLGGQRAADRLGRAA